MFTKSVLFSRRLLGPRIVVITACRVGSVHLLELDDFTYSGYTFSIYNNLELLLGIFNACLPVTKPVLQNIFGRQYFTWRSGRKDSNPSSPNDSQKVHLWGVPQSTTYCGPGKDDSRNDHDGKRYPGGFLARQNPTSFESWPNGRSESNDTEAQSIDMPTIKASDAIRVTRAWNVNPTI